MSSSLPLRANLEWLKKLSKDRLAELRAHSPDAQLSGAQLAVAREFGFASWPKLKAHVDQLRTELGKLAQPVSGEPLAGPDDPELLQLLAAIRDGLTEQVIELLERRPILAQSRTADGQTPLHVAARFNDPTLCMWLMAYGADPDAKLGESGHTVLSWAATCNAPECARALIKMGAKPDLFSVAGIGLLDAVRCCFNESGELRPETCRTGSSRFASDGTRLQCPPATAVERISDALAMAARNGQAEVVGFLLTKGADVSFRGFMGGTALHWAHFGGSKAVIEMLEAAGADPTARDAVLNCTPRAFGISVAANWGFDFIVRKLLASDPTLVNAVDHHTSPLHEAARGGHLETVRMLLEHQAEPSFRDLHGKTALDLAVDNGHTAVAELLQNR